MLAIGAADTSARLRSVTEMLDYSVVRVIGAWRALAILSVAFFAAPTLLTYRMIKVVPHGAAAATAECLLATLEYVGIGACACILVPLSPPLASKDAAIRALRRTVSIALLVCSAFFILILGTIVSAVPFVCYWVPNTGKSPLLVAVFSIPIALVFVGLIIWFVLITNVASAAIVRDGLGARNAIVACSRRLFVRGQRKRSAVLVLCASAPWIFVQAINYYLYYNSRHVWALWHSASLLLWIPAMLFELSLCLTYDEDVRARVEGADLFAVAERTLPIA